MLQLNDSRTCSYLPALSRRIVAVISVNDVPDRSLRTDDARRSSDNNRSSWNSTRHHGIGSNGNIVADMYVAEYLRSRTDINAVSDRRATEEFAPRCEPDGDLLGNIAVTTEAHFGVDDHAARVSDIETRTTHRPRWNRQAEPEGEAPQSPGEKLLRSRPTQWKTINGIPESMVECVAKPGVSGVVADKRAKRPTPLVAPEVRAHEIPQRPKSAARQGSVCSTDRHRLSEIIRVRLRRTGRLQMIRVQNTKIPASRVHQVLGTGPVVLQHLQRQARS